MPPASTSAQALGNLQSFQGSMQSGADIFKGQEQALGVPQAQQQVSGLRQAITNTTNLLNQVAPSVYGRTQNSLVTDAQAGRQIANEQAPISQQLNQEGQQETNATADLNSLLGQATTAANLQDSSQQQKLSGLESVYQALYGQEKDAAAAKAAADQFAAQQALEQQKLAEQEREANLSASTARSAAAAKAPTMAQQLQSAAQSMSQELQTVAGPDGYVSPQDYSKGLQAWTSAGLSPAQYDLYMAPFRNPANGAYWLASKNTYSSGNR